MVFTLNGHVFWVQLACQQLRLTRILGKDFVSFYYLEKYKIILWSSSSAAQEGRRKDIERAFGALQLKFNILNRPSLTPDLCLMNKIVQVCTILHNMVVEEKREGVRGSTADAVMQDAEEVDQDSTCPSELDKIQASFTGYTSYLKHLNNIAAHTALKGHIKTHLWMKHKEDIASVRLQLYKNMLEHNQKKSE